MSDQKFILALDQGTTSSRCIVFDRGGRVVSKAQREFAQIYPHPGWVEHNPADILGSQLGVIGEALGVGGLSSGDIAAIGITNQRETTLVWERATGTPVYNAIVWQCRRTAEYCDGLKKDGLEDMIYAKTGLILDSYFSATKIKWILDNVSGARKKAERGELCFGTVDSFLLWHLTKGKVHATDYSNAARTMLFDIHRLSWDEDLLKLFDIPLSMMPKVRPSSSLFGTVDPTILGSVIPICGVVGDQQGALFGQLCVKPGEAKNTYGTGCFLLMNTGDKAVDSKRGLITTLAATLDERPVYALEGSVFVGGAVIQWLRDEMRMIKSSADSEVYANRVPDTNGVYVVPAFVGLGAPYWDPYARGIITGITRGAKKEHIIRAALESIAYQVFDVLHAMERDVGVDIPSLRVDGGASANNFLMQFQADITGTSVIRPAVVETTALGAAYLAGLGVGYWSSVAELNKLRSEDFVFMPQMQKDRREELLLGWVQAVAKARA